MNFSFGDKGFFVRIKAAIPATAHSAKKGISTTIKAAAADFISFSRMILLISFRGIPKAVHTTKNSKKIENQSDKFIK
ncbi:hypothetical protein [Porcipelethomonas sp.]|uniref:hypothetical protein n=1 Tax=Porcipelethomonas sp. TaxID=2981675 RepID=UPI003EFB3824